MTSRMGSATGRMRVCILGCTGSIGTQTLDVCAKHPDKLEVVALACESSTTKLVAQAQKFKPRHVVVTHTSCKDDACLEELPKGTDLQFGPEAMAALCHLDCVDVVVNAVVGAAGIIASFQALLGKKRLAIANKEALVVAGDLLMPLAKSGQIVPIDSEHSAIFQCLAGEKNRDLAKIWLTCSGGPFYGYSKTRLEGVTAAQALKHPSWKMGPKITVDSATLMNKGLEVIEAHHLFNCDISQVNVLVHPESKIHSMVEFVDGSTIAQLGPSDMRIPIQYALSYPERWDKPAEPLNFWEQEALTFKRADEDAFQCLALAKEAGRVGATMPCAMNAANEVANAAFRAGELSFLNIARVVRGVMNKHKVQQVETVEQLIEVDREARTSARGLCIEFNEL